MSFSSANKERRQNSSHNDDPPKESIEDQRLEAEEVRYQCDGYSATALDRCVLLDDLTR